MDRPFVTRSVVLHYVAAGYVTPILLDITLSFATGDRIAVMGRSGSGKTTLIRLLCRRLAPSAGIIEFNNISIKNIALSPQAPVSFPWMTVKQHVMCVNTSLDPERYRELVHLLSLAEHESKKPHELSGGTVKRVSVGMALALQRPLVLLDEPTSGIDDVSKEGVWAAISRFIDRQNQASVVVTHSVLEAIWTADRVVALGHDGRIVFDRAVPSVDRDKEPLSEITQPSIRQFISELRSSMLVNK